MSFSESTHTPCPMGSPCRVASSFWDCPVDEPPAQHLSPVTAVPPSDRGWTITGPITPVRYVVGWPDGVVKVGSCITTDGARYRSFVMRGATILHLAYYDPETFHLGEHWLQQAADVRWPAAFSCRHEAISHLGSAGGGWTECFRIPEVELADLLALAVI